MDEEKKGDILLVEDDPSTLKAVAKIIRGYGYAVTEAEGGLQAKLMLEKEPDRYVAVVADLVMPHVSGGDVARFNRERKNLPFVAVSAFTDAHFGLQLLELGVHNYCLKPLNRERFSETLDNAINTNKLGDTVEDDTNPYAGNLGRLVAPSTLSSLERINRWVLQKVKPVIPQDERTQFMNFFGEFLLNAHEHGNLGIGEKLKSRLLEKENFDLELSIRENDVTAKLAVAISALRGQVAVSITDEGQGFDFDTYTSMTEQDLVDKIQQLNGRGIFMGCRYFDTVDYRKNGTKVVLTKNFRPI